MRGGSSPRARSRRSRTTRWFSRHIWGPEDGAPRRGWGGRRVCRRDRHSERRPPRGERGLDHGSHRTERRRQVDAAEDRVRVSPAPPGADRLRRAGHPIRRAARRQTSGRRLRATGDEHLPPAHRARESATRRLGVPPRRRARRPDAGARLCRLPAPGREATPARDRAVGGRGQDAFHRQGGGDGSPPSARRRTVGRTLPQDRGAGVRPAPGHACPGRDHSVGRPKYREGGRDGRLSLYARDGTGAARGAATSLRRPAPRDHPRRPPRSLSLAALGRRLGWGLVAFAALAWLPGAVSEYQTHVLTTCLYYVILAVGWNLLAGYTGQFSLAPHTFAAVGASPPALH